MPTSDEKMHVMALFGFACVNDAFRNELFADAVNAAKRYLPTLTPYEEGRLVDIATVLYADELKTAMAAVSARMGCPQYPCPEPLDQPGQV